MPQIKTTSLCIQDRYNCHWQLRTVEKNILFKWPFMLMSWGKVWQEVSSHNMHNTKNRKYSKRPSVRWGDSVACLCSGHFNENVWTIATHATARRNLGNSMRKGESHKIRSVTLMWHPKEKKAKQSMTGTQGHTHVKTTENSSHRRELRHCDF